MDSLWFDHLTDHAGAMHVHTVKSDGVGTLGEVVSAAERAGLSFLIITDHDTRGYAEDGEEGWHGEVLVIAGEEVSVGSSRYIVVGHGGNLGEREDLRRGLEEAREHGGITIALPPEDATSRLPSNVPRTPTPRMTEMVKTPMETGRGGVPYSPPEPSPQPESSQPSKTTVAAVARFEDDDPDWPLGLVDGWEFWCGLEDWARGRLDRKPMTNPFERVEHVGLRGPRRRAIRVWDELSRKGHILGFAGLNAHGRTWSSTSPGAALPYETLFRSLTTHVLSPALPRESPDIARALLLKSLRQGHFHTAQSCIASPGNFRFIAELPDRPPLLEGDTATFHPQALLRVRLPQSAEIRLLHNGHQLLAAEGDALEFPVVGPGVYRVEAWNDRRPWIFSSPIWFVPPSAEDLLTYRAEARKEAAKVTGSVFEDILDLAT